MSAARIVIVTAASPPPPSLPSSPIATTVSATVAAAAAAAAARPPSQIRSTVMRKGKTKGKGMAFVQSQVFGADGELATSAQFAFGGSRYESSFDETLVPMIAEVPRPEECTSLFDGAGMRPQVLAIVTVIATSATALATATALALRHRCYHRTRHHHHYRPRQRWYSRHCTNHLAATTAISSRTILKPA